MMFMAKKKRSEAQQLLDEDSDVFSGASAAGSLCSSIMLALPGRVAFISVELFTGTVVLFSSVWAIPIDSINRREASITPTKTKLLISLSSDGSTASYKAY
jgi:hypothetical protein